MSSQSPDACTLAKAAYEKAFLKWYQVTYIPAKGSVKEMCCKEEFDAYQKCAQEWLVSRGMDKKLKKWEARQEKHDEEARKRSQQKVDE